MKKKDAPSAIAKPIQRASRLDDCAEVLAHLEAECKRTGYKLNSGQQTVLHDLQESPIEAAMALLHAWWCYDLQKLIARMPPFPKPRISLSLWTNRRGTLIVSWQPTSPSGYGLENSDFRDYPYLQGSREDRLIEVREFSPVAYFHQPAEFRSSPDLRASVAENYLISNALLLQAIEALVRALKARLFHCFEVTMIDDIYTEWDTRTVGRWDLLDELKSWDIRNVAEHEKQEGLKLIEAFEATYGCSLALFIDVVLGPDKKASNGPAPLPHTKFDRSARKLKALGHSRITPSVVSRYSALIKAYRPDLLPVADRASPKVVPFSPKK